MNSWDVRAPLPAAALLAYALVGHGDWPFRWFVLAGVALWFTVTAMTGVTAMLASAKDDAEIHHEGGVARNRSSWAEILSDGLRLGAAPFLWLALACFAAAALGAEAIPEPGAVATLALSLAILSFAAGLTAYLVHVRACERRFRAR
ncbi:hypothetical protein [Phenylobacterium sp.]|jgi:hypothetical protein|uniref:hypothetical protein n=1 Tax=Phenylobacterium sp. TaxID=1871053 RepID=UPI002E347701|nr:hypothetical protein [Phenylobacterium sp.]HEX2559024.1 hypothetical protein [Phenylobacterium sp.]